MNADLPPAGVEIIEAGPVIRPWRAEDAEAVYRACQDPLIHRWTKIPRPYELGHADGFVTSFTETSWKSGSPPTSATTPRAGWRVHIEGLARAGVLQRGDHRDARTGAKLPTEPR